MMIRPYLSTYAPNPILDGLPQRARNRIDNNLVENAIRPTALGKNYEQLGIRQSLTRAKRDLPRWTLDMADDAALPVFA
jgi:hypothetical protein